MFGKIDVAVPVSFDLFLGGRFFAEIGGLFNALFSNDFLAVYIALKLYIYTISLFFSKAANFVIASSLFF